MEDNAEALAIRVATLEGQVKALMTCMAAVSGHLSPDDQASVREELLAACCEQVSPADRRQPLKPEDHREIAEASLLLQLAGNLMRIGPKPTQ